MYCSHCGTQVQGEAKFCLSCGKPLGPIPAPAAVTAPPRSRVQSHLQMLGVLWIAYGGLKLLGAGGALFAANFILPNVHLPMEARFVPALVSVVGWGLMIAAVISIMAGWGLLQRAPWARLLGLILAFLALFNVPFGTAIGVYTLWVLLPEESGREWEQTARA